MDQDDPTSEKKDHVTRRVYERPHIEESGDFERLVLTCTHKTTPTCSGPLHPGGKVNS
jgi:hypothetical protein